MCPTKVALALYNIFGLANVQNAMLFNFQGEEMDVDFEFESGHVGPYSCGTWFNGEYIIISPLGTYWSDAAISRAGNAETNF